MVRECIDAGPPTTVLCGSALLHAPGPLSGVGVYSYKSIDHLRPRPLSAVGVFYYKSTDLCLLWECIAINPPTSGVGVYCYKSTDLCLVWECIVL